MISDIKNINIETFVWEVAYIYNLLKTIFNDKRLYKIRKDNKKQGVSLVYDGLEMATINIKDRTVSFVTNGYYTKTTKRRINDILKILGSELSIYQKKGAWYFKEGNEKTNKKYRDGVIHI